MTSSGLHPVRAWRLPSRVAAGLLALSALSLAGCGGGAYLSYDFGGYGPGFGGGVGVSYTVTDDGRAPSVQISSLPSPLPAGGTLILGASAFDSDGIDEVSLYRIDGSGSATFLASSTTPPYQWSTVIPSDGRSAVSYFARAIDRSGRVGESGVVTAAIRY